MARFKKIIKITGLVLGVILIGLIVFARFALNFRYSEKKTKSYFEKRFSSVDIHFTRYKDWPLRYIETGNKESDTLILFVHGAPGGADAFYKYLADKDFNSRAQCVSIDRPGNGFSGYGKSMVSIEEQAAALKVVRDKYKASYVLLVGHSYGGPIVGRFAMDYPEACDGLVMIAPANDPKEEKILGIAYLGKWKLTRWLWAKSLRVSTDEKFAHVAELEKMESKWSRIKMPVKHIHGDKDDLVPYGNLAFSEKHISPEYLETITIPGGGHIILWTDYERTKKEILKSLK